MRGFLSYLLQKQVLRFGDFTLKSGRKSPYFFDLGQLCSGEDFRMLGEQYAQVVERIVVDEKIDPNYVLFGPAYKGIPLVVATSILLKSAPLVAFNRKEAKDHGEGGLLVGADLDGRDVILLDDVLTAGTAVRSVASLIERSGGRLVAVVLAFDRQERGPNELSAVQELKEEMGISVHALASMDDLLRYLSSDAGAQELSTIESAFEPAELLERVNAYRLQYGVTAAT